MKKSIYLIKKSTPENEFEKLQEISGEEFYRFVTATEGRRCYFIRLVDDIDYEGTEIIIEVSREEYANWRKVYDAQRYAEKLSKKYVQMPLEENLVEQQKLLCVCTECGEPEALLLQKENYCNLAIALKSLSDEEYRLIEMLYLREETLNLRQAAEYFGVSVSTIHKRKEKILKKMRTFW